MGNGGIGVVAAFVVSEIVVFAGAILGLGRGTFGWEAAIDMLRALGAAALTLLLFWALPPLPIWIGVPVCGAAFAVCSIGLGLVRRSDVELVRSIFKKDPDERQLDATTRSAPASGEQI